MCFFTHVSLLVRVCVFIWRTVRVRVRAFVLVILNWTCSRNESAGTRAERKRVELVHCARDMETPTPPLTITLACRLARTHAIRCVTAAAAVWRKVMGARVRTSAEVGHADTAAERRHTQSGRRRRGDFCAVFDTRTQSVAHVRACVRAPGARCDTRARKHPPPPPIAS